MLCESALAEVRYSICLCSAVHMPPIEGRLIQTWMYERSHPDDNHYSHPIDFVPLVDLNLKKVVQIDRPWGEAHEPWKVPKADSNYHRNLMNKPWRTSLKPLNIDQPEGPSFTVRALPHLDHPCLLHFLPGRRSCCNVVLCVVMLSIAFCFADHSLTAAHTGLEPWACRRTHSNGRVPAVFSHQAEWLIYSKKMLSSCD